MKYLYKGEFTTAPIAATHVLYSLLGTRSSSHSSLYLVGISIPPFAPRNLPIFIFRLPATATHSTCPQPDVVVRKPRGDRDVDDGRAKQIAT